MATLIVIEGAVDGIGKSTQYQMLRERLCSLGLSVVGHHFPSYNTPQGAPVEAYLRGELGSPDELSPYLTASLYAVDRAVTWHTELKAAADEGAVILLDRYTTSTLVYQSVTITDEDKKCAFIDHVTEHEYNKLGIPAPSLVIFLDAPYESAAALRAARVGNDGVEHDVHEANDGFMRRVYDNAQFIARREGWHFISCTDESGAMRSREDIHADIFERVLTVDGIREALGL